MSDLGAQGLIIVCCCPAHVLAAFVPTALMRRRGKNCNLADSYRMERLDLSVEKSILLYWCVAVHRPNQAVGVFTRLMRLFTKHGWSWPPMDLDVSPKSQVKNFSKIVSLHLRFMTTFA